MKTFNKIFGLALIAALVLVGCKNNDPTREPSPKFEGTAQVYFPAASISKELDPGLGIKDDTIVIARKDSVGELTIALITEASEESIFTVPASVTFADGVKEALIPIHFDHAKEGVTYTLILTVSDAVINPYSATVSKCAFSFVNLAWQDGESSSVWVDESWTGAFGMDPQIWYVKYQYVKLSDGSAKFRFLNPYASHPSNWDPETKSGTPDRFGVYDGFPANYPGDYDSTGTYNGVVSVDVNGKASWERFNTGVDWSYGQFFVGNLCVDYSSASEAEYPLGSLKDGVITFPKNSMYLLIPGYGAYPGGACVITLDSAVYAEAHSVKHIADFEDGFNDQTEMQWVDSVAGTSSFTSAAFSETWDQVLRRAVDIDAVSGEKSEFRNLWSLADLYEEGFCLAFYWDQEKGVITIPAKQPTGKFFAGKAILAGGSSEATTIEPITVAGTPLTKITFGVALTTEDGNLIGEYQEALIIGDAINWTIDAYCGNFVYTGVSAFDGTDVSDTVAISKEEGNLIRIDGLHQYSSGIYGTFDDATKTVSIVPQVQDSLFGKYDIAFFTIDALSDDPSTTAAIILKANMDGSISLSSESEASGWILNSKAAGGMLAAVYGFDLAPVADPEPEVAARKVSARDLKVGTISNKVEYTIGKQLSTKGMRIQGKAPRYFLHKNMFLFF